MLVEKITSRQNPLVKRLRRVRVGNERHFVFLEGVRLIEDALRSGARFETVAFTSAIESTERGVQLLDSLQQVPCRGAHLSTQVMEAITGTVVNQGVAAIVSRPHYDLADLFLHKPALLVIADRLQDPGNLGTIIRTAEAAGADGLITTQFTVEPWNDKALRASMGAALRLPIVTGAKLEEVVSVCRLHKLKITASRPSLPPAPGVRKARADKKSLIYTCADFKTPLALILSKEAGGADDSTSAIADEFVNIPMTPGVESLNVAAAAAILLYEVVRQRNFFADVPRP
ncbi:MAG TPA: RNA methyltransferase [Blastocatellia bacterium]|nr:RNA methyltransferase [Blastocatellia bacterium]